MPTSVTSNQAGLFAPIIRSDVPQSMDRAAVRSRTVIDTGLRDGSPLNLSSATLCYNWRVP
jgi:hypothetical protein